MGDPRPQLVGYGVSEGGILVRGTDDPAAAWDVALELYAEGAGYDLEVPEERADAVEGLNRRTSRGGWYRFNPCSSSNCYDGGGHAWHMGYAKGPGRGNFRAVEFWP